MKLEFKDLVADAALLLVGEHGFTRVGRRFTREDELIRSAWFRPSATLPGRFVFDILFDIGIAGVSSFSPTAQVWVVRCSASQLQHTDAFRGTRLELTDTADDSVRERVHAICLYVTEQFLLRHATAEELYQWVRSNALGSLDDPQSDNDFLRLHLEPFGLLRRLELAGVYAAYLGRLEDAAGIESAAVDYAKANRLRNYIPEVRANIAAAHR